MPSSLFATRGPLAPREKKQERVIGFFWACIRRGYVRAIRRLAYGRSRSIRRQQTTSRLTNSKKSLTQPTLIAKAVEKPKHQQHPASHPDLADALERPSHPGRGDTGKNASSQGQPSALPSEDRNSGLRSASLSPCRGLEECSRRAEAKPALFLLERQRLAQERRCQLAEKLSPAPHPRQHQQAGWFCQTLSSAYVPRHFRRRDAACRGAYRSGIRCCSPTPT